MTSHNMQDQMRRLEAKLKLPANRECFDCTAKLPRWASTNLGIFVCLRCAGIHRALGVHISKVRSVNMDKWEEDMIVRCERIGNAGGRLLYEHNLPPSFQKPDASCDASQIGLVIRKKYESKAWYNPEHDMVKEGLVSGAMTASGDPNNASSSATPPAVSPVTKSPAAVVTGKVVSSTSQPPPPQQQFQGEGPPSKASPNQLDVDWGDFSSSPLEAGIPGATSKPQKIQRGNPPSGADFWESMTPDSPPPSVASGQGSTPINLAMDGNYGSPNRTSNAGVHYQAVGGAGRPVVPPQPADANKGTGASDSLMDFGEPATGAPAPPTGSGGGGGGARTSQVQSILEAFGTQPSVGRPAGPPPLPNHHASNPWSFEGQGQPPRKQPMHSTASPSSASSGPAPPSSKGSFF